MTEHADKVLERKIQILAEEWAKKVKSMHCFNTKVISSMYYETRPKDGSVMDIEFNNGKIERTIMNSGKKVIMKEGVSGKDLYYLFRRQGN